MKDQPDAVLSRSMTQLLTGGICPDALTGADTVHAWRLLRWSPDVPLSMEQQLQFARAAADAFSPTAVCAAVFPDEGDHVLLMLAHTRFPARVHGQTVLWLCCHALYEACSLSLDLPGSLLVGGDFYDPAQWQEHLTPLQSFPDWWHENSPLETSDVHRHRAAIQTILKRRQYTAMVGYVSRALRTAREPGPEAFAFIPVVLEAIWNQFPDLELHSLTAALRFDDMTRRPKEALEAWLTSLIPLLKAAQTPDAADPIERVIAAIRAECSLPYTQANLSRSLGLTPAYFCRLFREKTGMHFSAFLTQTRMEHARQLMVQGGLSLQEIAGQCGYPNKSYFCQVFRKYTGMTPGEWEQQQLMARFNA